MSSFNFTLQPLMRSVLKPVESFLDLGQGKGVFATRELPFLKPLQSVNDDRQQGLMRYAVGSDFFDGAILEPHVATKRRGRFAANLPLGAVNDISVISSTAPWLVNRSNGQSVINAVHFVDRKFSHLHLSFMVSRQLESHQLGEISAIRN